MQLGVITTDGHFLEFIYPCWPECDCFFVSHNLQKRVANKEEKQRIQDDTKELAEKNTTIAEEMEKNQDLKNVEK